jgi:hypothetical protein
MTQRIARHRVQEFIDAVPVTRADAYATAVATLGPDLIALFANASVSAVEAFVRGEGQLNEPQIGVLDEVLTYGVALANRSDASFVIGNVCIVENDDSVARQWLRRSGLMLKPSETIDPVAALLRTLATDLYPLLLVPPAEPFGGMMLTTVAAYRHPGREALHAAIRADAALARLVVPEDPSAQYVMVYRSIGQGGSVQLELLPDLVIRTAWSWARLVGAADFHALEAQIDDVLATLRAASSGKATTCRALIAIAGLRLPDDVTSVDLPFGRLRHSVAADERLYPASLSGGLTSSGPEGETVQIDYAGDVVLETSLAYRVRVGEIDIDAGWPKDLREHQVLYDHIDTIALAAALAIVRSEPVVIGATWSAIFDPLAHGEAIGWRDARDYKGITPVVLSANEVSSLAEWVARIHTKRTRSIAVGIRRTLSSLRERSDPADSLVDAVVAWENLFGSRNGELTFRVSAAIARLLRDTPEARAELLAEVTHLYRLRSGIVHGDDIDVDVTSPASRRAREITLDMWRAIFRDEPGLIAEKHRARTLLLR